MQELEILNTPDGFTAIEDQKLEILQELYFVGGYHGYKRQIYDC